MSLSAGSKLGGYEILALIGRGGRVEVYRARDTKLGRDVANKILRREPAPDAERLRRFEQEVRSASALNHPNIIHIYVIGEHEGMPFIAMELVEGRTLNAVHRLAGVARSSARRAALPGSSQADEPSSLAAQVERSIAACRFATPGETPLSASGVRP